MIIQMILSVLSVMLTAYLLPGVSLSGFVSAVIVVIVFAAVNVFLKPILTILTLPITILTLGLFLGVINALLVLLTSAIVPGFTVENFWWALLFSLVLSLVNLFFSTFKK